MLLKLITATSLTFSSGSSGRSFWPLTSFLMKSGVQDRRQNSLVCATLWDKAAGREVVQNLRANRDHGDNESFVFNPVKFCILSKIIFILF